PAAQLVVAGAADDGVVVVVAVDVIVAGARADEVVAAVAGDHVSAAKPHDHVVAARSGDVPPLRDRRRPARTAGRRSGSARAQAQSPVARCAFGVRRTRSPLPYPLPAGYPFGRIGR